MKKKSILLSKMSNQRGQVFIEYVLLLAVILILSFTMYRLFLTGLGDYWLAIIQKIAYPSGPISFAN